MLTIFKHPVACLIGGCAIMALALTSVSHLSSTSDYSVYQRPQERTLAQEETLADAPIDSKLLQGRSLSVDDSANVALELTSLQAQLKSLKATQERLADRVHDTSSELSALRDASRANDDVSSPGSNPSPEAAYEAERSQINDIEYLLASEPADPVGSNDLHERIDHVLAQRESLAWLQDVRCGMSVCSMTLSVAPEDLSSDEMLVDSIIDEVEGGGMMVYDEERAELVLYVGRDGQSLPHLDPEWL